MGRTCGVLFGLLVIVGMTEGKRLVYEIGSSRYLFRIANQ